MPRRIPFSQRVSSHRPAPTLRRNDASTGMPGARARVGKGGQRWAAAHALLRDTGPEIIAGASDNDPTNVGTAVVVGARNGYQLSWVALLVAPMLGVVLAVAAQVSVTAGSDLQSLARLRYGRRAAGILLLSVVAANVVTIAADLQAGAVGVGLLAGVSSRWLVLPLAAALAGLLLAGRYHQMAAVPRCCGGRCRASWPLSQRPCWPAPTGWR